MVDESLQFIGDVGGSPTNAGPEHPKIVGREMFFFFFPNPVEAFEGCSCVLGSSLVPPSIAIA